MTDFDKYTRRFPGDEGPFPDGPNDDPPAPTILPGPPPGQGWLGATTVEEARRRALLYPGAIKIRRPTPAPES